jgi:hypothetical protein
MRKAPLVLARLIGQQRNQVRETVDPSPKSDAAQSSQRGIIAQGVFRPYRNAEAIAEAVERSAMKFVAIKSVYHVRALANTETFQQSRRKRKKIEMRFAHMKRILRRYGCGA